MTVVNDILEVPESPLVRIVRGQPTTEELVALVAGLMMLQGEAPSAQHHAVPAHSAWTDRATLLHAHPYRVATGDWAHSSSR